MCPIFALPILLLTPCGHNFCLKCFQKWFRQGKHSCANCRCAIPPKMANNPEINSALVVAIQLAKMSKFTSSIGLRKVPILFTTKIGLIKHAPLCVQRKLQRKMLVVERFLSQFHKITLDQFPHIMI